MQVYKGYPRWRDHQYQDCKKITDELIGNSSASYFNDSQMIVSENNNNKADMERLSKLISALKDADSYLKILALYTEIRQLLSKEELESISIPAHFVEILRDSIFKVLEQHSQN